MRYIKTFNRKESGDEEFGNFIGLLPCDLGTSFKAVPKEWDAESLIAQSYIARWKPSIVGIFLKVVDSILEFLIKSGIIKDGESSFEMNNILVDRILVPHFIRDHFFPEKRIPRSWKKESLYSPQKTIIARDKVLSCRFYSTSEIIRSVYSYNGKGMIVRG